MRYRIVLVLASGMLLLPTCVCFAQTCCPSACTDSVGGDIDLRLPFRVGEQYRVTQGYCLVWNNGNPIQGDHHGFEVDFCMDEGTPVLATAAGTVDYLEPNGAPCGDPPMGCPNPYQWNGKHVRLRHSQGQFVWYS